MKNILSATLFLFLITLYTNIAVAATFTVNDTSDVVDSFPGDGYCDTDFVLDNSPCTLRAALMEANADTIQDEIIIPAGTYTLSLSSARYSDQSGDDLDILAPIILTGAGAGSTIIDANGISRVLEIYRDATNSKLQGLTVTGGYLTDFYGAGIYSYPDDLTIENCEITGNTLQQDRSSLMGGGLYLTGNRQVLKNVIITRNKLFSAATATSFYPLYGAGAYINQWGAGGAVTLENVIVSYNEIDASTLPGAYTGGGGLYLESSVIGGTLKNIEIKGNTITGDGHAYGGGLCTAGITQSSYDNMDISDNVIKFSDGEVFGGGWFAGYEAFNTYNNIRINNNETVAGSISGGAFAIDSSNNNIFKNFEIEGQTLTAFLTASYPGEINGGGIYSPSSFNNSWENIKISNTTLTADMASQGYSFYLNKAAIASINGLEISDNVATVTNNLNGNYIEGALSLTHGSGLALENVRISRNTIEGDRMTEGIYLEATDMSTFNNIEISYNKNIHATNNQGYVQYGMMIYQYGSNQLNWSNVFIFNNDKTNSSRYFQDHSSLFYITNSTDVGLKNNVIAYNNVSAADNTLAMEVRYSEAIRMEFLDIYGNNSRGLSIEGLTNSSLKNSVFKNNHSNYAGDARDGGGLSIENTDSLLISKIDISGNIMEGNDYSLEGGGLYSMDSSFTLDESNVSDNQIITTCSAYGAGIRLESREVTEYNPAHTVIIKKSSINNNKIILSDDTTNNTSCTAGGFAHGAGLDSEITTLIEQSTIANNTIHLEANKSSLYGSGGGIYFYGSCTELDIQGNCVEETAALLSIFSSTIAKNSINDNTSKYGINQAQGIGGGLYEHGGNNAPKTKLNNTLLADNTAKRSPDCDGDWVSAGYNLISNMTDCNAQLTMTDHAGSRYLDAKLMPLANNGGSTETIALQSGSLAIDNGDPACKDHLGNLFTADQRGNGFNRPKDGDLDGTFQCDIGAFEVQRADELRVKDIF